MGVFVFDVRCSLHLLLEVLDICVGGDWRRVAVGNELTSSWGHYFYRISAFLGFSGATAE